MYASAQPLDFLVRTKNPSFPNRKLVVSHPEFPDGNKLTIPKIAAGANQGDERIIRIAIHCFYQKRPYPHWMFKTQQRPRA
jgi:hypothetical protein